MTSRRKNKQEPDSVYFLKILLFFIIGSLWLKSTNSALLPGIGGIPVGLILGLLFVSHDHFQIDRKIEYAVLLAACILSYIAPIGVVIEF